MRRVGFIVIRCLACRPCNLRGVFMVTKSRTRRMNPAGRKTRPTPLQKSRKRFKVEFEALSFERSLNQCGKWIGSSLGISK